MVRDFVQFLQTLHDELGLTIIIAEHHLEPLLPLVQRVLVLEDGHLAVDGSAAEACRYFAQRASLTDYIPDLVRLYTRTAETETAALPLSVREAKCWAAGRHWQASPMRAALAEMWCWRRGRSTSATTAVRTMC